MGNDPGFDGLYLGIDCGTQGLKTLLLDGASGVVVALASRKYGVKRADTPGVSEQDPGVWIAAARATIREVVAKARTRAKRIRGIAVSGQQHGMVALDRQGRVLRPAKLWNDTSTAKEAEELTARVGGAKKMLRLTGNVPPAGFTASKVLWFRCAEPDLYKRAETIFLPHDYLNSWLTGVRVAEAGDASGTGYFDVRRHRYSAEVVEAIDKDLEPKLPPIVAAGSVIGELTPARARELGLPPVVKVGTGGGDNMMAALGTGATCEGIVTVSLGTSGTLFAYSKTPVVDSAGEMAAFCDSTGGYLPLFCIQNCTNVTELVKRLLDIDNAGLETAARKAPAGCGGARMRPYFGGERTPNLPDARASIEGLTSENFDANHLARMAYEAPTLGLGYCLDRLRTLGVKPVEIRLTGGGAKSPFWRQLCADVFGVPVVPLRHDEGAALGAAICALWCVAKLDMPHLTADAVARTLVSTDTRGSCTPRRKDMLLLQELSRLHRRILG